jgi:drug/metabolite transporter (DMT)-like permease
LEDDTIKKARLVLLTVFTLICFAGNSLLCRLALRGETIDPVLFTLVRIFSGVLVLNFLVLGKYKKFKWGGSWKSGLALFTYAAAFSWAYVQLSAANGALILFGCVQGTMIFSGYLRGERLRKLQIFGCLIAITGLVVLLFPGISAPEPLSGALMAAAGIAWGVYSLFGRYSSNSLVDSAGNFVRALTLCLFFLIVGNLHSTPYGIFLAVISGAVTSGLGYAIWYQVLPKITATTAAVIQLSVPLIATFGGVLLLSEELNLRLALSSILILAGIGLTLVKRVKIL